MLSFVQQKKNDNAQKFQVAISQFFCLILNKQSRRFGRLFFSFLITLLRFMISIIYSSPGSKRLIRPNITVVFFFTIKNCSELMFVLF